MRIECPICKRVLPEVPADFGPRPFCSARCKLVDLGHWFDETYRIPGPDVGDEDEHEDANDAPLVQ